MLARPFALAMLSLLVGCVSYERDDASPLSIAAEVAERPGGVYTVDEAVQLALRQNPALRALEAQWRAASAATTVPLPTQGEWGTRSETVEYMLDPVALLGLGPRGAAIDAAEARAAEAVAQLVVARWQTAAEVAETFLIDAALRELQVVDVHLDVDGFERSGLASPLAAQKLRAAQARAASERAELEVARSDNRARLRRLLGLPGGAELVLSPIAGDWLEQPPGTQADLLLRPDLALAAAQFEVADAAFREAVADQYPSVQIGPNVSLSGDPLRAMVGLRLPIGMHGLAEAARERRQAQRDQLEAAFLRAAEEATVRDAQWRAARSLTAATAAALRASAESLAAARAALEVEVDAFAGFAEGASGVLRDTMEHRRAVLDRVRAEVGRAVAYGWPRTSRSEEVTP